MSSAKLALAAGIAALVLSACGSTAKPVAGTLKAITTSHKGLDDPRKKHIACLRQDHIPVQRVQATLSGQSFPGLQIGAAPSGPTVTFEPTPGAAQYAQISGQVQSAEVIGSALLYPNQASDALLAKVEDCVALGVTG
jgi:glycine/serine hydroxymethyltransferase